MKKYITISREYGSGGRVIGQSLAKALGYTFYDKELIDMAAKESGLSPDFIAKTEQNISSGWLYNLLLGSSYAEPITGQAIGGHTPVLPLADQVFNAQRNTILSLVKKGPCVIVGRCADYILRTNEAVNRSELFNVFIYGSIESKIKRAVAEYGVPEKDAEKIVRQVDKRRANHYNTFTENTWGDRANYDVLINSTLLGIEQTAEALATLARQAQ